MDPLGMLRDYTIRSRLEEISISNDRISFADEYDFPKAIPTAYRSQQGQGEFYVLETLVVFLRNLTLPHSAYMRKTAQGGVPAVTFQDRKTLIDYLQGRVDTSTSIQYTEEVVRASASGKRQRGATDDAADELAAKLAKSDDREGRRGMADTALERQLRTRQTMLVVPNKTFTPCIAIYLAAEKAALEQIKAMPSTPTKPRQPTSTSKALPKTSGRLERGPAAAPKEMKELGINIYGRGAEPSGHGPSSSSQGRAPGGSSRDAGARRPSGHHGDRRPEKAPPPKAPLSKSDRVPIIIVPEGLSAIVNMYNAKQFLQDAKFQTTEEAQAASGSGSKPDAFFVKRTIVDRPVPYLITDKVPAESDEKKWGRVVAVICQGKKWQFKNFPFRGSKEGALVETFASVCGIFFHWKDEEVPDVVKTWNVKSFPIARSARHHDVTQVAQMFDGIRKFMDNKAKLGITSGGRADKLQYK